MIVVSYDKQLRSAFAAGQSAALAKFMAGRKGAEEYFARTPKTYEEWIESIKHRPSIAIG